MRTAALVLAAAVAAGACTRSGDTAKAGPRDRTLVVAQYAESPATLDPALSGNVVTYVVSRPVLETLVTVARSGTRVVPLLATSWSLSPDGRSWTFVLRRGVRFHDGTRFDAAAVCANFDRWHRFRGLLQLSATEWSLYFGGFATHENASVPQESLYRSCTARTEREVVIELAAPRGTFLAALALPAFGIASPTALRRYRADDVSGTADEPRFEGSFGRRHLVGTGPFRLARWDRNDKVVLVRNRSYWGRDPALARVIVRRIDDGAARRQALEAGEIDGYWPVNPADIAPLRRSGFRVHEIPGLTLGFVGLNQARPPLDNAKIRRAIAHALDRRKVVRAKYQAAASVANEVVPPHVWEQEPGVEIYRHDPARARRLVAASGVPHPAVELWYPSGLPEGPPALPDPEGIALSFKADLERAGFTVTTRPTTWYPDWSQALGDGKVQLFLGDAYGFRFDPDALFDQVVQGYQRGLGLAAAEDVLALLDRAEAEIGRRRRAPLYRQANRRMLERLVLLPFVHVEPALAYSRRVLGYRPNPVFWEGLFDVRLAP